MLIINADDWGRSPAETDAAYACLTRSEISSVSAMVFMRDSERAASIAKAHALDVGLHLNFSEPFSAAPSRTIDDSHSRIVRFMQRTKYAVLIYNPRLRRALLEDYHAQWQEFIRLYGYLPTHVDGHQHRHLWLNLLLEPLIPPKSWVRRSFTFFPGEKNVLNRAYRRFVDQRLAARYRLTDSFFSLESSLHSQRIARICTLSQSSVVELMTHPARAFEQSYLSAPEHAGLLRKVILGGFRDLPTTSQAQPC